MAVLAAAEYVIGRPALALELVASALAALRAPGLASVTLRLVEGEARSAAGDPAGALTAFREGAREARELGLVSMALELEVAAAVVLADCGGPDVGVDALGEIVEQAAASGSVITETWARVCRGWLLVRLDPATALPLIEAALAEARRIDDPIAVAVGLRSLAYARLLVGDHLGAAGAAGELLDDLLGRGALSNSRLLVDVAAVVANRAGHPAWPTLAATAAALPVTTLTASQRDVVPLPDVEASVIGRREVIATVRAVLQELTAAGAARPIDRGDEAEPAPAGWIERRGDNCEVGFAGRVVSVRHSKGLEDLVRLIEAGGREIHCLDLAGAGVEESSTGAVVDDTARRQYEQRIRELQEELEEAELHHDLARAHKSQVELDVLIDHLTAALGMSNRTRSASGTVERARSTVTHRIRDTIGKLEKVDPHLGRHLRHAINTGTYCSYRPEQPATWRVT